MSLQELLNAGLREAQAGRFDAAAVTLRRVLREPLSDTDAGTVRGLLGVVLASQGDYAAAAQELEDAAARKPADASIASNLCSCLTELGRHEDAVAAGRRAATLNPGFAQAHNNLGNALQAAGKLTEAVGSYRTALHLEPGFAEAHNNLGNALQAAGDPDGAIASYREALRLRPEMAEAHHHLGNAFTATGAHAAAIASHRNALKLAPDNAAYHLSLGVALSAAKAPQEAIAACRRAVELAPGAAAAHNALGNALYATGDAEGAVAAFRRALEIHPDNAEYHYNLGLILMGTGDPEGAIASFRRALELHPDDAATHNALGSALLAIGDGEAAVAGFRQALALRPGFTAAQANLGGALAKLERHEEALASYDAADTPQARADALLCLYTLGRYDEFDARIAAGDAADATNRSIAALSAFSAQQTGRANRHPFCPDPLDFLHTDHVRSHIADPEAFLNSLAAELRAVPAVWDPRSRTTHQGFQSHGDLFARTAPPMVELTRIVREAVDAYHEHFRDRPCLFMREWPADTSVTGWCVRLRQGGYQSPHIHPEGWLSGVVYVELVEPGENPDEGAIVFGLRGDSYPVLNPDGPERLHHPQRGEIVMFPSSLYHRTVPITRDGERMIVAFDILPA